MTKNNPKLTTKLPSGKKRSHGGYTYLTTGQLPEHRKYVEQYLTAARGGLIRDLGPTEEDLTTSQIILIDRIICKLGVIRCIEESVRVTGVMQGENLAAALSSSYLAYSNSIRLSLVALGLDKKVSDRVLAPYEITEESK